MSASQVLLAGHGPEDRWLTETPNRTYFEAKYNPRVNRLRETFEIPFDNQDATFGATGRCTIPVKGDYMTRLTLRTVLPPIYPTVPGQYVYPVPSSQVGGNVYVNKTLTRVVANGTVLSANTAGSHYFSVGAGVTLSGTGTLDGTFTIATIPTANSFTCLTTLSGTSITGTASVIGITPSDVVGYFSTSNFDLWAYNLTNKTWSVTNAVFNGAGTELTVTTSVPSGFSVGQSVNVTINSLSMNGNYTIISATDTTFTVSFVKVTIFIGVGNNKTAKSTNGDVWENASVQLSGNWNSVTYGGGRFVAVKFNGAMYSTDGDVWVNASAPQSGGWNSVTYGAYGGGTFVAVGDSGAVMHSTNGDVWYPATTPQSGSWASVTYGGGRFVAVKTNGVMYSTDGDVWVNASVPKNGPWASVTYGAYGGGRFVAVGSSSSVMYSSNGDVWVYASVPKTGGWNSVTYGAYGGGRFVAVQNNSTAMYSTDGDVWAYASDLKYGYWNSVTYGNGRFVAVNLVGGNTALYSINGDVWYYATIGISSLNQVTYGETVSNYIANPADLVYLTTPPLVVKTTPTQFTYSSIIYPSISFATPLDAAFWGFDSRNGLTYSFPVTVPWTLTQSGWIAGFLPPSLSTWDDSVAHKICKAVRIMLGKQTIKEYSGEYIELQNDMTVSYENKAVLKLMNGTLDQTQSTTARQYYTTLPIGASEIPLCALTQQAMSVEVDFEPFKNLSQNLNPGTGDFLDAKSYSSYDFQQTLNVFKTLSYQQYIFIITYDGKLIVYDTSKPISDPESYIVITALVGSTGLFSQFCVLGNILYIQLINGYILKGYVDEVIQGNTSSFISNNYLPTTSDDIGLPTGTLIADARYLYYAQSNLAQSNVFLVRYDTQRSFIELTAEGYTSFDFTSNIDSTVTSVNQIISTGRQLVALTNTPGKFYIYNLNANFTLSWTSVDFSDYTRRQGPCIITEGVLIGTTLYFITNNGSLLVYSQDGVFSQSIPIVPYSLFVTVAVNGSKIIHSLDGDVWSRASNTPSNYNWNSVTYGNGTFVASGSNSIQTSNYIKYSFDGDTWSFASVQPSGPSGYSDLNVNFGNGIFIAVGINRVRLSLDGNVWFNASTPRNGNWTSSTYGKGRFVTVGLSSAVMYSSNGDVWYPATTIQSGDWYSVTYGAYGGGRFVAVNSGGGAMYSTNGDVWYPATTVPPSAYWASVTYGAYGGGTFVAVGGSTAMYSTDGDVWYPATTPQIGNWQSVTYGGGTFVAVSYEGSAMYSTDGDVWTLASFIPANYTEFRSVTSGTNTHTQTTSAPNLKNLHAVGSKIYASSNSLTVSSVIEIDTTKDLNSPSAYKYYSSTDSTAPITFDGSAPKIFANGPRFIYMFSQGYPAAQSVIRFDPYQSFPVLKTSILVDYESLPDGTTKPDKALLGLVQTQKVTDMSHMDIHGPVKELWVTGTSDSANVFQYSNLAPRSTLALAGEQIVTDDDGTHTFLNVIEPFETHTSMPIRNVSVVSFEFDPESAIPNGTINFSRIRDQVFDGNAQTVWARTYNILAIQGGTGGLMFN